MGHACMGTAAPPPPSPNPLSHFPSHQIVFFTAHQQEHPYPPPKKKSKFLQQIGARPAPHHARHAHGRARRHDGGPPPPPPGGYAAWRRGARGRAGAGGPAAAGGGCVHAWMRVCVRGWVGAWVWVCGCGRWWVDSTLSSHHPSSIPSSSALGALAGLLNPLQALAGGGGGGRGGVMGVGGVGSGQQYAAVAAAHQAAMINGMHGSEWGCCCWWWCFFGGWGSYQEGVGG